MGVKMVCIKAKIKNIKKNIKNKKIKMYKIICIKYY